MCLNKINTAIEHLLTLIELVLELSKIEFRRLLLEHIDFSLTQVLETFVGPFEA